MPAKDFYHDAVKNALVRDGWTILAEDYALTLGGDRLYADIAAEKPLILERGNRKVLVEVKSFLGRSFIFELERAIGQYTIYRDILEETQTEFELYLAVPLGVYRDGFQRDLAKMTVRRNRICLLVFDPDREEVTEWIPA
jgi:hypothetical protein